MGLTWLSTFGGQPGTNDDIFDMAVYDEGNGKALYVAGQFTAAGGVPASRVARWDGASWSPLGSGVNSIAFALAVFDDGSGPALFAGGLFQTAGGAAASRVAEWDGAGWTALGSGVNGAVRAFAAFDDGNGSALYVGGEFTSAGGAPANRIAKWDGSTWSALGSGMNSTVRSLLVHDDGGGPALYACGDFTSAGGAAATRVAKWDGSTWSTLGSGLNLTGNALAVFDGGGGPELVAAGTFSAAGGMPANRIAKWDGTSWSALDSGVGPLSVDALAVFDDGGGPKLYAGGTFSSAGGAPANRTAKWDGTSWSALGSGVGSTNHLVFALGVHDDGGGTALYVGGDFADAGGTRVSRVAKWGGSSWSALGSGRADGVDALAMSDDGSTLHAAGVATVNGALAPGIASWNGSTWSALGGPTRVFALAVHDDGSGPALHAGGSFFSGGGPRLYAGGSFTSAGGVPANRIAKWDGANWSALSSGMNHWVWALQAFDDGSGPALYAGGEFTVAGGTSAKRIARWNGSSWSPLGGGMLDGAVFAFEVSGDGSELLAGGTFASVDSGDSYLATWGCLDTTPPELACPSSVSVIDRAADGPGQVVTFTVTAVDDLDPEPVVVCVPPSCSTFPRGTTLVNCAATDASGNESTCQFPVTVTLKVGQRER